VASGVIGNLFYDALKQAVRKLSPSNAAKDEEDVLPELVFHAVIEQCRRYKLAVPQPDRMRLDKWERTGRRVVAHVSCMDSEMTAEVAVSGRQGSYVEVRIRDVSQRAAITRVAKKEYYKKYPRTRPRRNYRLLLTSVVVLVVALVIYLLLR
jgi:hypothetical protein